MVLCRGGGGGGGVLIPVMLNASDYDALAVEWATEYFKMSNTPCVHLQVKSNTQAKVLCKTNIGYYQLGCGLLDRVQGETGAREEERGGRGELRRERRRKAKVESKGERAKGRGNCVRR